MKQKQFTMLEEQDAPRCEFCSLERAEIFQTTGCYCLQCWQDETHPNV